MPTDWDDGGNIISVAILTFNEDEYLLEDDEKTRDLLPLIRQEVVVHGFVRKIRGKKRLKIQSYCSVNAS